MVIPAGPVKLLRDACRCMWLLPFPARKVALQVSAVCNVLLRLHAYVKTFDDLGQWTSTKSISGQGTITVLYNAAVALGSQASVRVNQVFCFNNIHLSWESHGNPGKPCLINSVAVILFVGPTPLNTAIALCVIEAGDGVE